MSVRLIPYEALKAKGVPYSKPHLWRLEKAGKFPRRVPIGAGRYAYVESEIEAHNAHLVAERDTSSRMSNFRSERQRAVLGAPQA